MFSSNVKHISVRCVLSLLIITAVLYGCSQPSDPNSRIERAIAYQADREFRAAMIELKNVLQEDLDNAQARFELGKLYVSLGQGELAEKELRQARKLGISADDIEVLLGKSMFQQQAFRRLLEEVDSDAVTSEQQKAEIFLLKGNAYFMLNEYTEAEEAFNKAQKLHGTAAVDAMVGLAKIAVQKNDLAAAEDLISQALSIDAADPHAWHTRGVIQFRRKDFDKAEKAFAKVTEIEGSGDSIRSVQFLARIGLVQIQISQGKTEEASRNIEWLRKAAPKHPLPIYFNAVLAYGSGDFDTAAIRLQEVLKLDQHNRAASMLMGAVNFARGNLEQADMYLSSLLAAAPDNLVARKLLAATRLQLEQPEQALAALAPAFEQGKKDSEFLALMGTAHRGSGDYDAGLDFLGQAVESDTSNPALEKELVATYLSAGKIDDAIKLLEKKLADDGEEENYQQKLMLILAYLQGKDTDKALGRAESLLTQRPEDPVLHNLMGSIKATMGHSEQALGHFAKAIELRPNDESALMNLGRLAHRQGRIEQASTRYKRVLEINPNNTAALLSLAQLAEQRGGQKEAIQWLEKARSADPAAVDARLMLTRYYLGQRNFRRAREIAEEAFMTAPRRPDVLNALGITQMWMREYREAVTTFKQALELTPESAGLMFNLSRAQLSLNDLEPARKNLRKTLQLAPDHIPAATMLITLEVLEGNTENALRLAKQQQEKERSNPAAYVLEGDIHLTQENFPDAVRTYRSAWNLAPSRPLAKKLYVALLKAKMQDPTKPLREWLDENPDDSGIRVALAQAYQNENQPQEAIKQYEAALTSEPDNPKILNNLAWYYHENKDSRAVSLAEKAHKLSPETGAITDTLGWLLVETGNLNRGVQVLRKAVTQAPDIPMIRYHLAVALARSGSSEEAKAMMNQVLESEEAFRSRPEVEKILQGNL